MDSWQKRRNCTHDPPGPDDALGAGVCDAERGGGATMREVLRESPVPLYVYMRDSPRGHEVR